MFKSDNKQLIYHQGFSSIEIMVSLSLGLLLIYFLFECYITVEKNYKSVATLNKIQSRTRTVFDIFKTELKQAGKIGCIRLSDKFPLLNYKGYTLNLNNKLNGNNHEFTVRYASFPHAVLLENMANSSVLKISNQIHFSTNDILLISDCKHAELFSPRSITPGSKTTIISKEPLRYTYGPLSEVSKLVINRYFIAKTKRFDQKELTYALYVEDINYRQTELVSGISAMQIRYVIKDNNMINEVEANQIKYFGHVLGIAIEIIIQDQLLKKTIYYYVALS